MRLDTDTVLWAVRGLDGSTNGGVSAEDVARFMAKDATLLDSYSTREVMFALESLVSEGILTQTANGDDKCYRLSSGFDPPGEPETPLFLLIRAEQLEGDCAALSAERDAWRQRAESAEQKASDARNARD